MAKYYYDKYKIHEIFIGYKEVKGSFIEINEQRKDMTLRKSYSMISGGKFTLGSEVVKIPVGDSGTGYDLLNDDVVLHYEVYPNNYRHRRITSERDYKLSKGSYVETVKAEEGTYPDDGIKGDYWYVKQEKVSDIKVNVNGEARDISKVYVNINGQRREVTSMYANINGQAKEVL